MTPSDELVAERLDGIGARDHSSSAEYRIFGPPGTGKTTNVTRQIQRAVDRFGDNSVLVTSFSRATAAELTGRDTPIDLDRIGTLHSHCFHALGKPAIAEVHVEDWNRQHPRLKITPVSKQIRLDGEGAVEDDTQAKDGDHLLQQLNRCRGMMLRPESWPAVVRDFASKWNRHKAANGLLDFCDLIDTSLRDVPAAPNHPAALVVDEAQDLNRMQLTLIRTWSERAQYLVLAGDDDQCQPPGTLVRTSSGEVLIEELDCEHHRLTVYAACDSQVYGERRPVYRFHKACRHYEGPLLSVRAGEKSTRCTPDHLMLVRWVKGEALECAHVVYLMRRGKRFRVGWCKLIRADGIFHLGHRARLEGADAAWVLKVFLNRTDASIYESYVGARYGLPLAMFEPVNGASHYTEDSLGRLFGMLQEYLPPRAAECLRDHGRDPRFPLYSPERTRAKRGGSQTFITEAANLLPCLMSVPVANHRRRVDWMPLDVTSEPYSGPVYSLAVETYQTYIADGIVVHNCIYGWAGASPGAILDPDIPEDHKVFLKQSVRVPRAVRAVAERLIHQVSRRQQKTYLPRPADGEVQRLSQAGYRSPEYWILKTAERHIKNGKSIMFLGSCSYMLRPIIAVLRKNGIPFHNPHRKSNGFWNPLRAGSRHSAANRLLALLAGHPGFGDGQRHWRFTDFALWVEWLRRDGVLVSGAAEAISTQPPQREVPREFLQAVFDPAALAALLASLDDSPQVLLNWWRNRLATDFRKRIQFPSDIAALRGPQTLRQSPQVVVGTIHSVKGGQADVVYLFPDLSKAADAQYRRCGPPRDSVIRTFYVGATRARETLYLCSAESAAAVSI